MTEKAHAEAKAFFEENGYVIVGKVYGFDEIANIKQMFKSIWLELLANGDIVQNPDRPLESLFPNRLRNYHYGNEAVTAFMLKPEVIAVLTQLMGEEPLAVQSGYYYKPPGTRGLGFHQDNYHVGVYPGTTYAAWVSLDRTDAENGSLLFVPGTHRLDLLSAEVLPGSTSAYGSEMLYVPPGYRKVQIATEPGDVVFFSGHLFHGSTKNVSATRFRQSFVTHFAPKSTEKVTLNYSYLVDRHGGRVRKKINTQAKIMETQASIFQYKDTEYYDQVIKKRQ